MPNKLKVVYLFGTGATQAEASLVDDRVRLGMSAVKDGILRRIIKQNIRELDDVRNELAGVNADVEQLITLYESSTSSKHKKIAKLLRVLFREEILDQIASLDSAVNGRFTPTLCSALIDMYEIKGLGEKLCGIMTLNYEDMIERAGQAVKGGVNYLLHFPRRRTYIKLQKGGLPVLKLHGSFNWRNGFPLSIEDNIHDEEDVLWIPPGVEKHNKSYPFNLIWGKARELLNCGMLRIVGCSLSGNEWHLVSMLYGTQKLNTDKREYIVEIISSPETGEGIKRRYPHLGIRRIDEIREVREFITNELYPSASQADPATLDTAIEQYLGSTNPFAVWLRAKGEDLRSRGISLKTRNDIFLNYIRGN